MDSLEKINKACKYLLQNNASYEVQIYLDSRVSREMQDLFDFGYYPPINDISLLTGLVSKEDLASANLLYSKQIEDSLFPRMVDFSYFQNYTMVLPFKDQYGRVKGIVGRTLLTDQAREEKKVSKYKNTNSFHKSKHLFGLYENKYEIEKKGFVYIVEGQFDVIKAYEVGLRNIVAIGSCSFSHTQLAIIKRYTNNIYVLFDNDKAGEKGRKKIEEKYSQYANIKNAYVPKKFKDLDNYITALNGKQPELTIKL